MSIRVAILGYGNLGKGMECAVKQNDDMAVSYTHLTLPTTSRV